MNKFYVSSLAIAGLGYAVLSFASLPAQADAGGNYRQCTGNSAAKVIRCCEQIVKTHGKPLWMLESHLTCQSAVSCKGRQPLTLSLKRADYVVSPESISALPAIYADSSGSYSLAMATQARCYLNPEIDRGGDGPQLNNKRG